MTDHATAPEWLDLKQAAAYVSLSERTLRTWIHEAADQLPASQVRGGKVLIRRSALDDYLERHRLKPAGTVEATVEEILSELAG